MILRQKEKGLNRQVKVPCSIERLDYSTSRLKKQI